MLTMFLNKYTTMKFTVTGLAKIPRNFGKRGTLNLIKGWPVTYIFRVAYLTDIADKFATVFS